MKKEKSASKLEKSMAYTVALVLLVLPLHAFFTAWAASNFGHFDLIRIWKELLIAGLAMGAVWVLYKDRITAGKILKNRLVQIILAYLLFQVVMGLIALAAGRVNLNALLYGWIINARFLVFFLVALIAAAKVPLESWWHKLLFWPAILVVGFGLVHQFLLPADFLRHFGYGDNTLLPYQAVDLKTAYIRLQSTLRGPNPAGVYLLVVLTALLGVLIKQKRSSGYVCLWLGSLLALYFTYSRSAWLGTFAAFLVLMLLLIKKAQTRKTILLCAAALTMIASCLVYVLRNNDHIQNVFFHTDEHSMSGASSNYDRAGAIKNGLTDLVREPLGRGPGTAGPASLRNDHEGRISENYFIQIGQELGTVGLILFLAINVYVLTYLLRQRANVLSAVLAASFIGISVANLLSHAWADDIISLIWWGLAGIALAPAILNKKRKHNV